jgi:drug/metabolite transporter (DMT)-like permease
VTTQLGQVAFTRGLQLEPAGRATAVGYLQIVFAALWGIILLGERPDAWSVAGALIIVGATLVVALRRRPDHGSPRGAAPAHTPAVHEGVARPGDQRAVSTRIS